MIRVKRPDTAVAAIENEIAVLLTEHYRIELKLEELLERRSALRKRMHA